MEQARAVIGELPAPNYGQNYQVPYDPEELREAIAENIQNKGVATADQIDDFSAETKAIGEGRSRRPLIITNSCAEDIMTDLNSEISRVAIPTILQIAIIRASAINDPIEMQRIGGQYVKPRSEEFEILADGRRVESYKGPGINHPDPLLRVPDASRLVQGAVQARDLQEELTKEMGEHVLMAHELLSLAYDVPFVREHPKTGKPILVSAHLPWGGVRTNGVSSVQNEVLSQIDNPVGQKIGADSDPRHIAGLSELLNPEGTPGKIVFMLRLHRSEYDRMPALLNAIAAHAEGSLVMYDIHGVTETNRHGEKIRDVRHIEEGIERMAYDCDAAGLSLNGLHLETMSDYRHLECIEERGQRPTRKGHIDPRLNPMQTRRVLDFAAQFLNR